MKPMLASESCTFEDMQFPLLASIKLDGIRCLITKDGPRTRSLKPVPNKHIATLLSELPVGLDGELVTYNDKGNVDFRATTSAVMSRDGKPNFQYCVFDSFTAQGPFGYRTADVDMQITELIKNDSSLKSWLSFMPQITVKNAQQVQDIFAKVLEKGHEGLILRSPCGLYKHGRATTNSQWMMKMKPWCDAEATIIEVIEAYANHNEAQTNELGRTKRSTAMEGLVPKGTLGSLLVQSPHWSKPFEIGTGWDATEALRLWKQRASLVGRLVKFSYVDTGGYDVPRHCSYQGIRDERDL